MTPETPQAGKRSTAKTGSRASGAAGSAGPSGSSVETPGATESVSASAATPRESGVQPQGEGPQAGPGLLNQVRQKAASQIREQKDRATDGLGGVAQAVRESTQQLRAQHYDTVAEMVERAADQLERFSSHLRERDLDQLVDEAQQFARRNPSVFIGTSFAAGLVAARFIKASRPESGYSQGMERDTESWTRESRSTADANRTGRFDTFDRPRDETRGRGEL